MNTIQVKEKPRADSRSYLAELLPGLQRLDNLLTQAVTSVSVSENGKPADLFRGLYINPKEVEGLLSREPGIPIFYSAQRSKFKQGRPGQGRLEWLQKTYNLSPFDLDLIFLALAPELDRRYERIYAYLQDHVNRRFPTVDLALNLLCPDAHARIERRRHFDPQAPLIRQGLIRLQPDDSADQPTLLSMAMRLDQQIVRFLLHEDGLDFHLATFCRLTKPAVSLADLALEESNLPLLIKEAWQNKQSLCFYLQGPEGADKRKLAEALATYCEARLLSADLTWMLAVEVDFPLAIRKVFRAAWLHEAIIYMKGLDELRGSDHRIKLKILLETLASESRVTILAGEGPWRPIEGGPAGVQTISLEHPDFFRRRRIWQLHLAEAGIDLEEDELDALTARFRLLPGQIAEATASAKNWARWCAAAGEAEARVILQDLFAAARDQSGHALETLARKIKPVYDWEDIVLPDESMAQLKEICLRLKHSQRVLGHWGFGRKLSLGKGVNALFAGPTGTGKTMAAEIIAQELDLELYKIDLAGVVSKYIGETEKNLDRIFRAAEDANAILFFDEADALFGKRSEVRDSHDRYANIEISYLLQKMEEYDGVSILTTNLRQNLDEAFMRRLAFTVHFPFPDADSRKRIWAGIWPAEVPLARDLDFEDLAGRFKLAGGNIKNVALAASFLAAEEGNQVTRFHLLEATRREYQKMGKVLTFEEMNA